MKRLTRLLGLGFPKEQVSDGCPAETQDKITNTYACFMTGQPCQYKNKENCSDWRYLIRNKAQ